MKIMGLSKVSKGMTNSKDEECGIILRISRISDQQVLKKWIFPLDSWIQGVFYTASILFKI